MISGVSPAALVEDGGVQTRHFTSLTPPPPTEPWTDVRQVEPRMSRDEPRALGDEAEAINLDVDGMK